MGDRRYTPGYRYQRYYTWDRVRCKDIPYMHYTLLIRIHVIVKNQVRRYIFRELSGNGICTLRILTLYSFWNKVRVLWYVAYVNRAYDTRCNKFVYSAYAIKPHSTLTINLCVLCSKYYNLRKLSPFVNSTTACSGTGNCVYSLLHMCTLFTGRTGRESPMYTLYI